MTEQTGTVMARYGSEPLVEVLIRLRRNRKDSLHWDPHPDAAAPWGR
jgi:hypothetical protein